MRLTLAQQMGTIEFPPQESAGEATANAGSSSSAVARAPPRRPHGIDYNQLGHLVASCPHLSFLHGEGALRAVMTDRAMNTFVYFYFNIIYIM